MIKFVSNGNPDIEIDIKKGTAGDRQLLIDLKNNKKLRDNVDLIYIYSLIEEQVPYPKENGNIVYIGEAGRQRKTGTRFAQHISTKEKTGGDTGTNYTLSHYYWSGKALKLRIFILNTKNSSKVRKEIEGQLFQVHLKKYGALPIAQGASGKRYTVSVLENLKVPDEIKNLVDA